MDCLALEALKPNRLFESSKHDQSIGGVLRRIFVMNIVIRQIDPETQTETTQFGTWKS